ncbi:MAG: hypothetical protein RH948_04115 [Cyclobacteriaceae bacterium]
MINPNQILYRGDSDYNRERDLRGLLHQGLLKTNLVNGGDGREVFERPLIDSIRFHVSDNWKKTHFLSFTEDINTAFNFGKGIRNIGMEFEAYYEDDDDWHFAILTLDIQNLSNINELSDGVYSAYFIPVFKDFLPKYDLIIIDVVKALSHLPITNSEEQVSLYNAGRDKEWLIFPASVKNFGRNMMQFRGLLDCALFSDISKYLIIS